MAQQSKPIQEEQSWRANTYALLARLLRAAPDDAVLNFLCAIKRENEKMEKPLRQAWAALSDAAKTADAANLQNEFQQLFIGISRGEVLPYGSYYQCGFMMDKPLVLLRDDLQKLGLQRQRNVHEPEDHVAALFEVMIFLIREDRRREQIDFFTRHVNSWLERFFDDLEQAESALFYQNIACLGRAFVRIEQTYLMSTNLS